MKKIFSILFLFVLVQSGIAQELNCTVEVVASQIQRSDKKIFETLKASIFEFMNNTRWTNDAYKNEERIECSIMININDQISTNEFAASIQVQSRRPVFNTSYNSVMMNYSDNDFQFSYLEYQPFNFSINSFENNLSSVLAFYAYMIIGFDYDSFSLLGGTPYFQKAQAIVSNAQSAPEKGWKAFEGNKNRYWMVENILTKTFEPLRICNYNYHRKGLDMMTQDMDAARDEIYTSIEGMKSIHKIKPSSFSVQLFFTAKSDEIVYIYSKAFPDKKAKIVPLCSELDPGNINKYQKIMSSN